MNKAVTMRKNGDREESEQIVDKEIEALREILLAFNRLDDDARKRAFEYLKNKYRAQWPSENY